MITKITLENFMAHERTELELGPGVNALTGPNNTGKSAIVEALRCVATNPVPRHNIRHGATEARVGLEFEDGTRIVWVRKKRSSGYELWLPGVEEPEEYWKFGRKPPEDILDVLRLDLVELETGGEVDVHVGNQREPIFLLNQPGSNAAAFFAASTESAHLLAMQNLLKRRTQDVKRQERDLKERLSVVEDELDRFEALPDIAVALEEGRELESTVSQLQSEIPHLEKLISTQRKVEADIRFLKGTTSILKMAESAPNLHDINTLSILTDRVIALESSLESSGKSKAALQALSPVPATFNTVWLAMICRQLQEVETTLAETAKQARATDGLAGPPSCEDDQQLSGIIDQVVVLRSRRDRESRRQAVLQNIAEPPVADSDKNLAAVIEGLCSLEREKQAREAALGALETALQSVKDDIEKRLGDLGCCPTCGADIESAAFLDRRCRHDG